MSGHSKWSQIKRKKGASDAKRGQIFTKLATVISQAVKEKGGDPKQNFKLRLAIEKARAANMPKESIDRAMKKGVGGDEEKITESTIYEAHGPEGIALLIESGTDNKKRTTPVIRKVLENNGFSLGESGSVRWNFKKNGVIEIDVNKNSFTKEEVELFAIDSGAENTESSENIIKIITSPKNTEKMKKDLSEKGINIGKSYIFWMVKNKLKIKNKEVLKNLISELKTSGEAVNVYHNCY